MPIRKIKFQLLLASVVLFGWMQAGAQAQAAPAKPEPAKNQPAKDQPSKDQPVHPNPAPDYSGMYSFLREGEFVQVTVEPQGRVTGFVSRYGDKEDERGAFLDHFFKQGKLDGNQLTFTTESAHGLAYEFRGAVERGEGKNPGDEAYYVLKGTLTENTTDEQKKTSSRPQEVTLKSFPQDLAPAEAEKK